MRRAWADGLDPTADLERDMAGLAGVLVRDPEYVRAAAVGANAMPDDHRTDAAALGLLHAARVLPYAEAVAARVAALLAADVRDARLLPDAAAANDLIAAAVEGKRHAATRYAGPQWAAGMAGYANSGAPGLRYLWVLDDGADHCDDCPGWAEDSEAAGGWAVDDIPTYPGAGDSRCLDKCRCRLVATAASWRTVYGTRPTGGDDDL